MQRHSTLPARALFVLAVASLGVACGDAHVTRGRPGGDVMGPGDSSAAADSGGAGDSNTAADSGGVGDVQPPRLTIDDVSLAEGESGTTAFVFTVTLDSAPDLDQDVAVAWATADGTATAGSDYQAGAGTLTFTSTTALTQSVSVTVTADTAAEPDETFEVVLSNAVNAMIADGAGVGTILADEPPQVRIDDASVSEGDASTTTLTFTISLDHAPATASPVTVDWATVDGTATAGEDYVAASGSLTFVSTGALAQTIDVTVNGDAAIEPDETLAVLLSGIASGVLADATGAGTLVADDFPSVSIADLSTAEGSSGTTTVTLTATLSAAMPAGYDGAVAWATADDTATAPSDYLAALGTLTFGEGGGTTQAITVSVAGDGELEPDETFTVTLSAPTYLTLGTPSVATVSIRDDDWPRVTIDDVSTLEGTGAGTTTLTFTVTLDLLPAVGLDAVVGWATVDDTATAASDYSAASGLLTFTASGGFTQPVSVTVTRDAAIEPDETLRITLTDDAHVIVADGDGVGTLLADDFPDVSIAGVSANEGNGGSSTVDLVVTTTAPMPTGYTGTVDYATGNLTALAGSDYQPTTGTLTFTAATSTSQTIAVTIYGDLWEEDDETFTVTLANASHLNIVTGSAIATIVSDDSPHASIRDATVLEGDSGTTTATFTVSLSSNPPSGSDAVITWASAPGSASVPSDFVSASGSLTFVHGGALNQTVAVTVNGDTLIEGDELFTVTITAAANAIVDEGIGVGAILDDDRPTLSVNDVTALEGNSGATPFVFTVSVYPTPRVGADVTVNWATGARTAASGTDFTAASGSLTFTSAGPASQTVSVSVVGDTTREVNEELALNLSGAVNGHIRDTVGIGTIVDDDGVIIRVDPTGADTDGLTWATAYRTVQAGVNRASALGGGQVWLAAGRYNNGSSTVLNMLTGVSVVGGFDGYRGGAGAQEVSFTARDLSRYVPVLDGGGNALHTVTISVANTVLDGVKVTGGNAVGASPDHRGGGLYVTAGSPLLVHDVFANNAAATYGGGIELTTGGTRIRDCRIYGNRVSGCNNGGGGGLHHSNASVEVLDTVFKGNSATCYYGGGFNGGNGTYKHCRFVGNTARHGGGGQSIGGTITLIDSDFIQNHATSTTGGFENNSWSNDRIYDCTFMRNSADGQGGAMMLRDSSAWVVRSRIEENEAPTGGGLYIWNYFGGVQQLVQVRIANNRASSNGGGIAMSQASPVLVDVVLEGNTAAQYGGGIYMSGSSPTLRDCTLMNDVAPTGPELYLTQISGTPPTTSNPVAANTILWNRTSGVSSVATLAACAGCSFTSSTMSMTDLAQDALFNLVPLRSNRASTGTTTTLNVSNASSFFAVNDVVEIQDDGVARAVSAVTATQLTFAPALAAPPPNNVRVDNWGPVPADLAVDLRLQATSPCVDAGDNGAVGIDVTDHDGDANVTEPVAYDFAGNPRFVDDPAADTGFGSPPLVDIGAYERQ